MQNNPDRGQWSSRFGFVLATAGSAVGLANIWAFPFRTGQNGGAAFVMIYLCCIVLICLPFMIAELSLGRHGKTSVVGAIRAAANRKIWMVLAGLCVAAGVFILSFYSVVAGWSLGYIFKTLFREQSEFTAVAGDPLLSLSLLAAILLLTVMVVVKGVRQGIERWSRILMPSLILLMLGLIIYGLTLPGAFAGVEFFLKPDFSELSGTAVMTAMGQAFFSLSLGVGGILTYGSYLSKREDIFKSAVYVVLFDTGIAILAGLMIFPALFSFGQQPDEGPALVFFVLPQIFSQLPLGHIIGAVFFLMLTIAALTSTFSMLEIPTAYLVDEKGWTRRQLIWPLGMLIFMLAIPSALSSGAVPELTNLSFFGGKSFLELMIFVWFDIVPPLGALLFSILIGWVWGIKNASREISKGSAVMEKTVPGLSISLTQVWAVFIRFICPIAVIIIWINAIFFD